MPPPIPPPRDVALDPDLVSAGAAVGAVVEVVGGAVFVGALLELELVVIDVAVVDVEEVTGTAGSVRLK